MSGPRLPAIFQAPALLGANKYIGENTMRKEDMVLDADLRKQYGMDDWT